MKRAKKDEVNELREWASRYVSIRGSFLTPKGDRVNYFVHDLANTFGDKLPCPDAVVAAIHDKNNYCIILSDEVPRDARALYAAHEYYDFVDSDGDACCQGTDEILEDIFNDRPEALHTYFSARQHFYARMAEYASANIANFPKNSPYTQGDVENFQKASAYAAEAAQKYAR